MRIFKDFGISDVLRVDDTMLAVWLKLMESHYHQRNAYHNSTHAADVLQSTAYFIKLLQDHLVSQGVSHITTYCIVWFLSACAYLENS